MDLSKISIKFHKTLKIFIYVISILYFIKVENSYAKSVGESMGDFWNDIGGSFSNSSEAGGYQLQGAGYYTGGSFTARSKVVSVNPVNITPPGIRAGCGGIDIYTGSFSHINTDQFIALLKAIPSNAIGFAFQLALETMSPSIKGTLDQLQSIIDRINNINLNSCDMAQGLVGGGLAMAGKTEAYCKTTANSQGWATDYARASAECKTGGKSADHIKSANNVHGDQRPVDINIAWEVLKKSPLLKDDNDEMAEFVQALTGTIIVKTPANESDGPEISYKSNIVVKNETVKAILEGGQITILTCDDKEKCLNPSEKNITIAEDRGFKKKITKIMNEMVEKLASGEKFESKHIDLVSKTSIPIHKAMIVRQAYFGSSSAAIGINPEYYSSLIAIDMLYNYLDEILKSVQEQAKQVKNFDQENVDKFQKGVENARKELAEYRIDSKDSFERGLKIIEETQKIQSMLASRMSNKMKMNLLWASKF